MPLPKSSDSSNEFYAARFRVERVFGRRTEDSEALLPVLLAEGGDLLSVVFNQGDHGRSSQPASVAQQCPQVDGESRRVFCSSVPNDLVLEIVVPVSDAIAHPDDYQGIGYGLD